MTTSNYETLIRRWPLMARLLHEQVMVWPIEPAGSAVRNGHSTMSTHESEDAAMIERRSLITSELISYDLRLRGDEARAERMLERRDPGVDAFLKECGI
jgi:hypothetical protein